MLSVFKTTEFSDWEYSNILYPDACLEVRSRRFEVGSATSLWQCLRQMFWRTILFLFLEISRPSVTIRQSAGMICQADRKGWPIRLFLSFQFFVILLICHFIPLSFISLSCDIYLCEFSRRRLYVLWMFSQHKTRKQQSSEPILLDQQ